MTTIKHLILVKLEEENEIHGIYNLAELVFTNNRVWLRKQLAQLQQEGSLYVIHNGPGRGRRNIIRRSNRNSPGYPRKVKP